MRGGKGEEDVEMKKAKGKSEKKIEFEEKERKKSGRDL